MTTVLILGAGSTIAQETARKLAAKNFNLILAARRVEELTPLKCDLEIRYDVNVDVKVFEALDFQRHEGFFQEVVEGAGRLDGVMLMYGAMADQKEAEQDFSISRNMIDVNYTSAVSILNIAANYFEKQKRGFIAAVSSVAGDRGRQSNYLYGSTKAGLSVYMEGLRNRLHQAGIQVLTIKPGMVASKMTYGVVDDSPLLADPEKVAGTITKSISKRRDVIYTPWFWMVIMFVIKRIPETIFKRTDI